jgi:hypothetical protein
MARPLIEQVGVVSRQKGEDFENISIQEVSD